MSKYDKQKRNIEVQTEILTLLYTERKPFTVSSLSKRLGFPYTSVNNVVRTLKDDGYVTREAYKQPGKSGRPRYLYHLTSGPEKLKKLRDFLGFHEMAEVVPSPSVITQDLSPESTRRMAEIYIKKHRAGK